MPGAAPQQDRPARPGTAAASLALPIFAIRGSRSLLASEQDPETVR